jgi:hypothetical protein
MKRLNTLSYPVLISSPEEIAQQLQFGFFINLIFCEKNLGSKDQSDKI